LAQARKNIDIIEIKRYVPPKQVKEKHTG
jgi:hypothetical protein